VAASYVERLIDLTFQLGTGSFGDSGSNQLKLTGLRVVVHVEFANTPTTGPAQIRVYGMTPDHINQLSRAGLVYKARVKYVAVEAGDAQSGMTTVYNGLITEAYPDGAQPNLGFLILASPSNVIQLKPQKSNSYSTAVRVETVLKQMAGQAGLTLENNGVNTVLAYPYFSGSIWDQINKAIDAADCFGFLDGVKKTLAIWPKNGSRSGGATVINAANGMIGYPKFQGVNIVVRSLFDPSVKPGQTIRVESNLADGKPLQAATGTFTVISVSLDLASKIPDGPWEMTILATPPG
jgi:hypothetical protein